MPDPRNASKDSDTKQPVDPAIPQEPYVSGNEPQPEDDEEAAAADEAANREATKQPEPKTT